MMNSEFLMMNEPHHSLLTIQNSLFAIKSRLTTISSTPGLDAQVLLAHITGKSRAWLLAHSEIPLSSDELHQLEDALHQLVSGLPLPYLVGEWEFFGLKFSVTPDVLIPRPETELLVETALAWINQPHSSHRREESTPIWAADIGTGSGCIAISLAVHAPDLHLLATDISPAALAIACQNAQTHRVADRITFLEADLLNPRSPIPDPRLPIPHSPLLLANLPYIPTATLHTLAVYGREPTLALDGGPDGLALMRRLLVQAESHLAPGGLMLLEIEATQGNSASALAREFFPEAHIQVKPDLAGHDRLLCLQIPLPP